MDFVTVSTGLILPYWMGLPIRYIQQDGTTYLDDVAVDILDQHRKENPVVIINKDTDSRLKQLEDENKNLLIKVAQQADKISQLNEDLKNKIE